MRNLYIQYFTAFALLIATLPAYSQFTYYIGMEEPAIRADLASRNVQGLGTDYTSDGQKLMKWIDTSLRAGMVIVFDGAGKAKSTTLIPFTPQDLNQYIEVFHKEEKLLEENTWLSSIDGRNFKISKQFFSGYSKFGFVITDYDREIEAKKLEQVVKSLEPIREPTYSSNPATHPVASKGVYNTSDTNKINTDDEIFKSPDETKDNGQTALVIFSIVIVSSLAIIVLIAKSK